MIDSIIRVGVAVGLFLAVALLLGTVGLLTPKGDVSVWGLIWRIALVFVCLGLLYRILSFGPRKEKAGSSKTADLIPGSYLVISGRVETISPEVRNGINYRSEVVLVVRLIGNGVRRRQLLEIPKEKFVNGCLVLAVELINRNDPPFRLVLRDDGTASLFQELSDGHKACELEIDLKKR